jgi:UDP:flavonoid glycosyltransferase YjiC (YdhE family)
MARILIAWELGEAFGHLARCLRLAEGLRQRGHTVVLAFKNVRLPAGCSVAPGITVRLAPLTPREGADRSPPVNYADMLRVAWQSREAPKVLAYLRPAVPGFQAILRALARLDADVLCVAPGMNPETAKRCATRRLRIALAPVDLPSLLEHADLTVGYGNSGFSTQALLAGVPLAMRPRHVEQALLAQRVEALGAGKLLVGRIGADSVTPALQELLGSQAYRQAARTFRERHRHFPTEQAIEQSLSLIERAFFDGWGAHRIRHAQEPQEKPQVCLH